MASINPVRIIAAKRDGHELSQGDIESLIAGSLDGTVSDEQLAAWAMAVYFQGMTDRETAWLTDAMLQSGATLRWPGASGPHVDKHSTGGIGDKASLILAPLLACHGLRVPMLSGRGLGPTGGTLDKLESIPGFRTDLSLDEIETLVDSVGCVITGTTQEIAPADRKLYALRDVTGTVPSIPLITASIMSKKLAEGLDALVLDVKWGSGAFMKELDDARALARSLVATGQRMGVATSALITDMNQPLGRMIGNACEVVESIDTLRGRRPADVRDLTIALGAELLLLTERYDAIDTARVSLEASIDNGSADAKFQSMVQAQSGRLEQLVDLAPPHEVPAPAAGYVQSIDGEALGYAVIELGGGRRRPGDAIDHGTGLECLVRIGDRVEAGQPWIRVFGEVEAAEATKERLRTAISIGPDPVDPPALIVERIGGGSEENTEHRS